MISTSLYKELTLDNIYEVITGFDIFKYYVTPFEKVGQSFCSELRPDKKPDVRIFCVKGNWFYKDFANADHIFNPVGYVMYKYGISFHKALQKINHDFNLGLGTETRFSATAKPVIHDRALIEQLELESEQETDLRIVSIPAKYNHKLYWRGYGITQSTLDKYRVKPIGGYYLNGKYFRIHKQMIAFAYCFGNYKYKILQVDSDFKWITNAKNAVQGYNQLPDTGDVLVITSSLKDVMLLYEFGIPAIAPASENSFPSYKMINELKVRFKRIVIFFDNDEPGIKSAVKYSEQHMIDYIHIPEDFEEKDISDFYKSFRKERTEIMLDNLLE